MNEIAPIIFAAAVREDMEPRLIAAVILQESRGDPDACRFEETWFRKRLEHRERRDLVGWKPDANELPSLYDEKVWRAHSWGLMQILGETARALGFLNRYLPSLIHPVNSVNYGALYLGKCFDRAAKTARDDAELEHQALLYYNGGGDPDYPRKVRSHWDSSEMSLLIDS